MKQLFWILSVFISISSFAQVKVGSDGSIEPIGSYGAVKAMHVTNLPDSLLKKFNVTGGTLSGTSGAGYLGLPVQSSSPAAQSNTTLFYRDSAGGYSFRYPSGFIRGFRAVNAMTANRSVYYPDSSGTIALKEYTISDTSALHSQIISKLAIPDTAALLHKNDSTLAFRITAHTGLLSSHTAQIASNTITANFNKTTKQFKNIFYKTYFTGTTDFTASGVTPTINNGAIRFTGGAGNFNQYITLNNIITTDENVDFEVVYRAVTNSSTSYGISIGKKSLNTWYDATIAASFDVFANTLRAWDGTGTSAGNMIGQKPLSQVTAANDVIRLRYTQNGNVVIISMENLTQLTYDTYTITANMSTAKNFKIPNTSKFCIWNNGGTMDILSVKVTSSTPSNPYIALQGDSKTFGYSSTSLRLRFASMLAKLGSTSVFAGDGDRTVEAVQDTSYIKAVNPKYLILNIGRNDLASSVVTATWQANYRALTSAYERQGIIVVHLLPLTETIQDQSTLKTFINANYTSVVDPSVGWSNATMLSSDNIHPNEAGMRFIADKIINSGLIPSDTIVGENVNLYDFLPKLANSNLSSTATTKFIPQLSGTNSFINSSMYQDSTNRMAIGTTTPNSFGSNFSSLEINGGTGFGAIAIAGGSNLFRFYLSAGGQGSYFGRYKNYNNTYQTFYTVDTADIMRFGKNGIIGFSTAINPDSTGGLIDAAISRAGSGVLRVVKDAINTPATLLAASIGIGTGVTAPNTSALLDVTSTTQGVLFPRLTTAQRDAIVSPSLGLVIYNTTLLRLNFYNGSAWTYSPLITNGTAAPATTPTAVGDMFIDTVNKKTYSATGTSSSADWTILN